MKTVKNPLFLVAFLSVIFLSTSAFAQFNHLEFIHGLIEDISFYAHPMNTRIKGETLMEDKGGYVDVNIKYKEGITKIRFIKTALFFSDMYVVSDSDQWPAFYAFGNMKSMAITMIQQQNAKNPKAASELERYLLNHIKEWDGRQLAMFCLYLRYLGY